MVLQFLASLWLMLTMPQLAHAGICSDHLNFQVFKAKGYVLGDEVRVGTRKLLYQTELTKGNGGCTPFLLADSNDREYVLKIISNETNEVAKRKAEDRLEAEWKIVFPHMKRLGIKVPKVYFHSRTHLLRDYTPGITGTEWHDQWMDTGFDPKFPGYKELVRLFQRLVKGGVFFADVVPKNLTWDGTDWWVFDPMYVQDTDTRESLLIQYVWEFSHTWCNDVISQEDARELLRKSPR